MRSKNLVLSFLQIYIFKLESPNSSRAKVYWMRFITSAHVTIMFIHGNRKISRCHFSVVSSCTGTQRNETLTNCITTPCMDMKTIGNPPCTGTPGQPPFFPDNRKSLMKHHHLHLAVFGSSGHNHFWISVSSFVIG